MNNSKYIEFDGGTQATQVGEEFVGGMDGNVEIERLLGFESQVVGGQAARRASHDPKQVNWTPSPDWCGDDALAVEELSERGVTLFILKSVEVPVGRKSKKALVAQHVAVFELGGTLYVTRPFEQEERAAACALWFVLSM